MPAASCCKRVSSLLFMTCNKVPRRSFTPAGFAARGDRKFSTGVPDLWQPMRCVCAWRAQCNMLSQCSRRAQGLCNSSVHDCVHSVRRLRPARFAQAVQAAALLRAYVGEHGSVVACTFSEQFVIMGTQADGEPYKLYFYMSPYMRSKQVHPSLDHPASLPLSSHISAAPV